MGDAGLSGSITRYTRHQGVHGRAHELDQGFLPNGCVYWVLGNHDLLLQLV